MQRPDSAAIATDFEVTIHEVGDRVWVARHRYLDVNVGIIGGERGLVFVDTLWSGPAIRALIAHLTPQLLGDHPDQAYAVVNTHAHWDHVLGNAVFADQGVPTYAHETAIADIQALRDNPISAQADTPDLPRGSRVAVPDRAFSSVGVIDLGDRLVELLHPGRGHTGGDVVVRVGDADVMFLGDLVEHGAPPSYGPDSFPLEWPTTLDLLADLIGPRTAIVPGHGAVVGQEFVGDQRAQLGVVAETIRELAGRGVRAEDALQAGQWPYDPESLADAVARGYSHLPRSARQLPLL